MAAQLEGVMQGTNALSDELMQWLKKNKLENQQLIELLTEQEIECVDDLVLFRNSLGDDKEFTQRLDNKGFKIGTISKLLKALNNYNNNPQQNDNDNQNQSSGSILMLDKQEKEAIQLLSSKLFDIETKLKSLPEYSNKLSSSKECIKQKLNNICNEWIKLIHDHKQSLNKWIESIEQTALERNKVLNKKLNDELHLIQETKSKCQSLMSFASINDIWTPKQPTSNQNQSEESVVSLVTDCVDKLDKSLEMEETNIFDQMKIAQFNKQKAQELLNHNIYVSFPKESVLSVNIDNKDKVIKFTVQTQKQFDLYSSRELFVKIVENTLDVNDDDEKKDDLGGITKLTMVDNKCCITVQELDNKLGEYKKYVAYIVETLDKIAIKRDDVPFEISRMHVCYGNFKFDKAPKGYVKIIEDGTRMQTEGGGCYYVSIASTTGWNKGKYYWFIKSNGSAPGYNCVGVCTDPSKATAAYNTITGLGKTLYYDGYSHVCQASGATIANVETWSTGDIIKILLDCNEWKVTFHKNDKFIGTFELETKNVKYYPCLQMCGCKGHDYKLLSDHL